VAQAQCRSSGTSELQARSSDHGQPHRAMSSSRHRENSENLRAAGAGRPAPSLQATLWDQPLDWLPQLAPSSRASSNTGAARRTLCRPCGAHARLGQGTAAPLRLPLGCMDPMHTSSRLAPTHPGPDRPARQHSPTRLGSPITARSAARPRAASPPPPWSRCSLRRTWLQQSLQTRIVDDTLRTERLLDGLDA
jgi:hypothetical protein